MNKLMTILVLIASMCGGCCIINRNICEETPPCIQSGFYECYTNGVYKEVTGLWGTSLKQGTIYYRTSYVGGPYEGSHIYPSTRHVLNMLSLYSYSSAASGAYMLIGPTLLIYPFVLCELPIQFTLDTILIPFDLYNSPNPPEGYKKR